MKKQYIIPLVEVIGVNSTLMQVFGPASVPNDNFNGAPERRNWWLF